jgi:hypothetical protein
MDLTMMLLKSQIEKTICVKTRSGFKGADNRNQHNIN